MNRKTCLGTCIYPILHGFWAQRENPALHVGKGAHESMLAIETLRRGLAMAGDGNSDEL